MKELKEISEYENFDKKDEEAKDNKVKTKWEKFVDEHGPVFEEIRSSRHGFDSTIYISNIPNPKEFKKLMTILKDKYTGRKAEYIITTAGFDRFYSLYKSSGLFDTLQIIELLEERFCLEYVEEFQISIADSIQDCNNSDIFALHMTYDTRDAIGRLLQDIRATYSKFGFIACVFTFNKAKEEFKGLITEKYKIYYEDDGYFRIIKEDFYKNVEKGKTWLVNVLPKIIEKINSMENEFIGAKNKGDIIDDKKIEEFRYKKHACEELINNITRGYDKYGIYIPAKTLLDASVYLDISENKYIAPCELLIINE